VSWVVVARGVNSNQPAAAQIVMNGA
jgi:hypothetical protein